MRTNSADYGHGGAYVRKREVRALARVCSPMAFIAALLAMLLVPTIALADSSIIWGPSSIPNAENGIVVNAPDRYRAAAVALGYSDADIASWSGDVLAKLSNQSTGGHFYEFAQLFGEIDDAIGNDNPLTVVVSAVGNSFWAIAESLYGDDIWLAGYSSSLAAGAAADLSLILSGENIGGGGSGGDNSFTFSIDNYSDTRGTVTNTDLLTSVMHYSFSENALNTLNQVAGSYQYVAYYGTNSYDSSKRVFNTAVYVVLSNQPPLFNSSTGTITATDAKRSYLGQFVVRSTDYVINSIGTFENFTIDQWSYGVYYVSGDGGSSEPVIPPSNWPDEPSAPTPPELPEPGTNPTVTPTPWAPVISPTFDFDLNITTEPTSNDLIDWVKKIYYELRSFHGDAHDWFDEVGKGIDGLVDAIDDAQEQIYDELQTIDDTLRDEGQRIRDYMYQMFHWLKEQLNFQNDTFDDNNIVYWLKRIWSKLGSGDINLRPTDPTNDPDDWWDWLVKAIQNFLIGLAATSTELISEIADLASQVMHEFPFSIPWDIAAVLAALTTSPITPVFTVTVPAISGWWNSFDIVIDMSPFDGAAETIRLMEKLLFTGLLIWKSKELLDFMDVTKWFN